MLLERLKLVRSRLHGWIEGVGRRFFGTDRSCMDDLLLSSAALRGALELARDLMRRFSTEKRRRRMMDFSGSGTRGHPAAVQPLHRCAYGRRPGDRGAVYRDYG